MLVNEKERKVRCPTNLFCHEDRRPRQPFVSSEGRRPRSSAGNDENADEVWADVNVNAVVGSADLDKYGATAAGSLPQAFNNKLEDGRWRQRAMDGPRESSAVVVVVAAPHDATGRGFGTSSTSSTARRSDNPNREEKSPMKRGARRFLPLMAARSSRTGSGGGVGMGVGGGRFDVSSGDGSMVVSIGGSETVVHIQRQ